MYLYLQKLQIFFKQKAITYCDSCYSNNYSSPCIEKLLVMKTYGNC